MTQALKDGRGWRITRGQGTAEPAEPYLMALQRHAQRGPARFHVPAHNGGRNAPPALTAALGGDALALDVPACIEGIDIGTGAAETPLAAAERLAAHAWGARRTWFLVNGATEAGHALCLALGMNGGGRVVVQRNVHASTMHGLVLAGLEPTYVQPELDPRLGIAGAVTPRQLAAGLDATPDATAALVVSPTYYGATADVRGLAAVCHERGVALVVDEAWGAHFAFHPALPEDAVTAGADAVVSGTHKLLGSLTQSAMLHLGSGDRLSEADVQSALALVRTTSPSALLLASLDVARAHAQTHGHAALTRALAVAAALRDGIRAVDGLDVVALDDPLRVTIDVTGIERDGLAVADALLDEDIHVELATSTVVILHLGAGERPSADHARLLAALDRLATPRTRPAAPFTDPHFGVPARSPRAAYFARHERVPLADAAGRVSADTIAVYPPGIANVVPGERLTDPLVKYLLDMDASGWPLRGTWDATDRTVRCVIDSSPEDST